MKIGNRIALFIIATGMTCSMPAQTPQPAAAKQKISVAGEKSPAIDLSKVPLQEGIHEIYRDAQSGLRVFRIVNGGKEIDYFAVDTKGEVLTPNGCGPVLCFRNRYGAGCFQKSDIVQLMTLNRLPPA